jgi:homoserine dehydrogenase
MANDKVRKIAGTFSGTLGFVMSGLEAGRPFSEVVLEAKAKGYTEPDSRDDLGGVDVARKALILARGLGWRLELSDVQVEPLYPPAMASLSVDEFLAQLPSLDADLKSRASAAKAKGEALRYAATIENGKLNVGLVSVSVTSPLGSLSGTDNLVEYYTTWYDPSPLVVRGAGAGAGATAAGVVSDMVELSV